MDKQQSRDISREYNEALAAYLEDDSRENWARLAEASRAVDRMLEAFADGLGVPPSVATH